MDYVKMSQLEKLLTEVSYGKLETFCVGRFIIQPIYWAQVDENEIAFHIEDMTSEFNDYIENQLPNDFYENQFFESE